MKIELSESEVDALLDALSVDAEDLDELEEHNPEFASAVKKLLKNGSAR